MNVFTLASDAKTSFLEGADGIQMVDAGSFPSLNRNVNLTHLGTLGPFRSNKGPPRIASRMFSSASPSVAPSTSSQASPAPTRYTLPLLILSNRNTIDHCPYLREDIIPYLALPHA